MAETGERVSPPPGRGSGAGGTAAQPRVVDRQARYNLLMQTGKFTPEEAAAIAANVDGRMTPGQRAALLNRIQRDVAADFRIPGAKKQDEVERRFRDAVALVEERFKSQPAPASSSAPATAPKAPASAAPPSSRPPSEDTSIPQPRPRIPQAAVERLRANPHEAAQFDQIFGRGAAARVLGQ
jgi:hypothetical protein